MIINNAFSTIYVVKPEYAEELGLEIEDVSAILGNLIFSPLEKNNLCFALDVWHEPSLIEFNSISEAARILRSAGKFWFLNPIANIRRSCLIQEQLPKLPPLERKFPLENPIPEIGCFSLLDKNTLVFSTKRWKKWPLGHCQFIEDKQNPPNRAYLKLWEALTLLNHYPKVGDSVVDLGASPGGWTYVMQSLGAQVTAIDKSHLDAKIARLPRVTFLKESAFAINPQIWEQNIDWLLCDVACYPERLYDLTLRWIASNKVKNMIFTIKLQGKTNIEMINKFKAIPNSRTVHLFHNKHEATFFYPALES